MGTKALASLSLCLSPPTHTHAHTQSAFMLYQGEERYIQGVGLDILLPLFQLLCLHTVVGKFFLSIYSAIMSSPDNVQTRQKVLELERGKFVRRGHDKKGK